MSTMMMPVLLWGAGVAAAQAGFPIAVSVSGPWTVTARTDGDAPAVSLAVTPPPVVAIQDERHESAPLFNPKAGGWRKGLRLKALITEECTATGLLDPDSVRVKPAPGDATPFVRGRDYDMDGFWATLGRLEGGGIAEGQELFIDYIYSPNRLDSVVIDASGATRIIEGEPGLGAQLPPEIPQGCVAIANIWVEGRLQALTDENIFTIQLDKKTPLAPEPTAAELLPKTLAKLRAGEEVTIVAWGDSVTHGGGVGDRTEEWYQNQFLRLLEAKYPTARIRMLTAAWPGGTSKQYMEAPAGGPKDFKRDVLDPKPDLVTIEFVNDAYLDEEGVRAHYSRILEILRGNGAEVILITPHFVRPDWMKAPTQKLDEDPRPYVHALRRFAAENNVALADASRKWARLWRQGIPYMTLEANSINHPDVRGHAIFAQSLIELFP